jgi:hypothetical protein
MTGHDLRRVVPEHHPPGFVQQSQSFRYTSSAASTSSARSAIAASPFASSAEEAATSFRSAQAAEYWINSWVCVAEPGNPAADVTSCEQALYQGMN